MYEFKAELKIIGVNPYVDVPEAVLVSLLTKAQKEKGAIPVYGRVNGVPYTQTLVRYLGAWRLYINMKMLKNSPKRVGETIHIEVDYDPRDRTIPMPPLLCKALENDRHAREMYESLKPSLQKEINRYIANLKTEEKVRENVQRALDFLNGKGRFIGREALNQDVAG